MSSLHFSTFIKAPREKVWEAMLSQATYSKWTAPFSPTGYTSNFEGNWKKGSKIKFLGINKQTNKQEGGIYAEIADNRLNEFISIKHLGSITTDGTESAWPNSVETLFENYTLIEKNGGTELLVDMTGLPEDYIEMMKDGWPKAFEKLKDIVEHNM